MVDDRGDVAGGENIGMRKCSQAVVDLDEAVLVDPRADRPGVGVAGGGVWDPSIRGIYALPAELQWNDVLSAVVLSLGLSFVVTIFPARRAARMNPVEALRYE